MNSTGITLAVITMLLWGISPLLDKLAMREVSPLAGLTLRVMFAALMVGLYGIFAGVGKELAQTPRHIFLLLLGSAFFGAVAGQAAPFMALKYADASRVVPIAAAYPLASAALAVLILHEGLTWPRVLGALLVIAGVSVLTLFNS